MEPEMRDRYENELVRMNEQLEQARVQLGGERAPRYPSLREQAEAVGLGFSYSLAYRFDSQSAAHPSAMAIEQLFEDRPDLGGIQLLPEPPAERGYADPYGVGAFILYEALNSAAAQIPELALDELDEVGLEFSRLSPSLEAARVDASEPASSPS
jgi:hypothetical protein